jgi:hypothetical protein
MPEGLAGDAEAMRGLLAANLAWDQTAGGTFAKLPGTDIILARPEALAASPAGDGLPSRRFDDPGMLRV